MGPSRGCLTILKSVLAAGLKAWLALWPRVGR